MKSSIFLAARKSTKALSVAFFGSLLALAAPCHAVPAEFTQQPSDVTIIEGQSFTLAVEVSGTLPITIQWYKGTAPILSATHLTFPVVNATLEDSGTYYAVASNDFSTSTSTSAVVEVREGAFGPEVHFHEGFETAQALDDWDWTGPWEIGVPTSGPNLAYEGTKVAGTVLAGNYTDNTSGRMISPPLVVPPAANNPRLRWAHWYAFNSNDSGRVQVQVGAGQWTDLPGYPALTGSGSGAWSEAEVDLSAYAGLSVRIGFLFTSSTTYGVSNPVRTGPGWYIDGVELVTGPVQALAANDPEAFEEGFGDWWVEGGTWAVGVPTSGPGSAFRGESVAATVLGGNYADGYGSVGSNFGRLVSPPFVVSPAANNPRLRWAHWYAFNSNDLGLVQVQVGAGQWTDLPGYPALTGSGSGVWSEAGVDLSAYAGLSVRIGFLFTSSTTYGVSNPDRTGPGWYIDEVELVTGPYTFDNPEGFEKGWGDWYVAGGSWEIGTPANGVGPGQAHTGTSCAGTVLAGNYSDGYGSVGSNFGRLVSPPFVVPPAISNPRLRFWNWHSFNSDDSGKIQIQIGTGNWQTLATYTATTSGVWSRPAFDLSEYAGLNVRIGFLFTSSTTYGVSNPVRVDPGWYIDEVRLLHDFTLELLDSPIMQVHDSTCVSLGIAASLPASTVSFLLTAPAGHLADVTLNPEGCWSGTIVPQADGRWLVTLENACPETPMGVAIAGSICFTAVSEQSAFVPLEVRDVEAGFSPVHVFGSRAVVIANEPLTTAWVDAGRPMLTLYGKPYTEYELRYSHDLTERSTWPIGWRPIVPGGMVITFSVEDRLEGSKRLFICAKVP